MSSTERNAYRLGVANTYPIANRSPIGITSSMYRVAISGNMLEVCDETSYLNTNMPVIRKAPNLSTFYKTSLHKEMRDRFDGPKNNQWSLLRDLRKRENGLAGNPPGIFSPYHNQRIATLFAPNKKQKRMMSLGSQVYVCKMNKDGTRLIIGCQDAMLRVFDATKVTYPKLRSILGIDVEWSITDVDFSPCGIYFAYSSWAGHLLVCPMEEGIYPEIQSINLHMGSSFMDTNRIYSLRFSPCGRSIIAGSSNGRVYEVRREVPVVSALKANLNGCASEVNAVSYLSDMNSNLYTSGCTAGVLRLWDNRCVSNRKQKYPVSTFLGHFDGITYIDSRNDGNHILTNSKDQSIKIWDVRKPTPCHLQNNIKRLPLEDWDYRWDDVPAKYFNPKRSFKGDTSIMTYRGHRVAKSLLRARFSPASQTGQRYIYAGCATGRIIIYEVLTGAVKEAIEGHKSVIRDAFWHPNRPEIVSGSFDHEVNLNTFQYPRTPTPIPLRRSTRIAKLNNLT